MKISINLKFEITKDKIIKQKFYILFFLSTMLLIYCEVSRIRVLSIKDLLLFFTQEIGVLLCFILFLDKLRLSIQNKKDF